MALNLHLLRLFTAVADNDGVVAAARALRLSQPAISRAIRELEQQLGLRLFERTARRVRLTPEGAEIYRQAKSVFAAEHAVEEAVAGLKGVRRGTLHIGASTTIATYVLPEIISAFAHAHPEIEVRLSAVHTRVLVDLLKRYDLDIALAEAPISDPRIDVAPWRVDEMVVIASRSHRLATQRHVRPADLDGELFVLREAESGTRSIVLAALHAAGIRPARSMSIDGTEVIKQVVAEGLGIAVVSRFAIADQLATGRLVEIRVDGLRVERSFNWLSLPGRQQTHAAAAFHESLERSAPDRPGAAVPAKPHASRPPRRRSAGRR